MINPRIPSEFYNGVSNLESVFIDQAININIAEDDARILFALLPKHLQEAPVFRDRLTNLWRYDFGIPIDNLPGDYVVFGTHMFPPVDRLVRVLYIAYRRVSEPKLGRYLHRLSNAMKHQDVLAEFSPILGVNTSVDCEFEVPDYGVGNRTIDWLIRPVDMVPVLLDVKCRTRDLIEGLAQITYGRRGPDGKGPAPLHNVAVLFQDTKEKFIQRNPNEIWQGAWIVTQLKQERSELHAAFESLDPTKLHFAVITNWQQDAYLLNRDGIQPEALASLFGITHSNQFVFDR